ncbi:MAG: S-layer protein [Candidatus Micrarchaeota archaeon]
MKSLNVKRIAAIATGASMLLGAAFAGAAVDFDSAGVGVFPFFSGGEPQAKIVIGAKAQPADVVVAGNIAAVMGNLAYKTSPVEVLGKDKLGVSGTGGDLTDKTVGLTITTPGVNPATAYEMKAYLQDDLDNFTETTRYSTSQSRFQQTNTSFSTTSGPKVITKDMTSVIAPAPGMPADGKINYPTGTANTKEDQKVYAFAYVKYDENDKEVQAKYVKTGYEAIFTDPIPLCLDTAKNDTTCDDSKRLAKNNVEITFLGDKWTIFDHSHPAMGPITSVTLGKQITRQESFSIDQQVTTPDGYVISLKDISAFSPQRAMFEISDSTGKLVKRAYLGELDTTTITEANNVVLKVNKVFPGAFAKTGTADVSMFSSQLVITNNNEISGGESHKNWMGMIQSATVGSSEGISKIQLYNDIDQVYKSTLVQDLKAGESIDIIKGMAGYRLNFLGLEPVDYDVLQFNIQTSRTLTVNNGTSTYITQPTNLMTVTSGKSNAFQFGSRSVGNVYWILEDSSDGSLLAGQVYYLSASGTYYTNDTATNTLTYFYSADESAVLLMNTTATPEWPTVNTTMVQLSIPELTEENNGTAATYTGNYHLNMFYDKTLDQFVNTIASTTADKIGYEAYGHYGQTSTVSKATKNAGYITYRGNIASSISSLGLNINYAKKVARARFTLTGGAAGNATAGNSASVTLKEGDPYTIGSGYSLKVDSISAKVTTTGAGAVSGIENLVPSVTDAAVVTQLNTDTSPLVVLDSEAGSTANMIVVGGQIVNTVAAGAGVDIKEGDSPQVKVYGSTKLVVAGYTATDTTTAGNELIKWMNDNSDKIRG